ncbi:MAG: type VII toxin-antitoxin system MntA family adenylyltransferase antitoxin [Actinomycetota bacterium]
MEEIFPDIKLVTRILQENGAVLAFVFGSAVKGKQTRLSDIDIAVLLDKSICRGDYNRARLNIMDRLGRLVKNKPVDVAILNNASPLLAQLAVTRGRVIFCKDDDLRVNFQVRTLKEFDDALYLRRVYYKYLEERVRQNRLGEMSAKTG